MATDILPSEIPAFSGSSKVSTDYTFTPETMRITVNDLDFKRVLYIVNSTHSVVMYNPYDKDKLGEKLPNGILLNFPENGYMKTLDDLLVVYESEQPPVMEQGGRLKSIVVDDAAVCALNTLIKEQRITNYYLAKLSDEQITHKEIL